MKKKYLLLLLCVPLLVSGCGKVPELQNGQQIVVELNGKQFTAEEFFDELKENYGTSALINLVSNYITDQEITDELAEEAKERAQSEYNSMAAYYGSSWNQFLASKNYTGVIAASLSGDYQKQAAVYEIENGIAFGSFRGVQPTFDYRTFFEQHAEGNYAQGHKAAFGFQLSLSEFEAILNDLDSINVDICPSNYLTAGDIPSNLIGEHHIYDINDFKRQGNLLRLAIGNSHVNSSEQIEIIVPIKSARLVEQRGKLYIYDVLGIQCKAFEILTHPTIRIYAEQSNLLNIYAKN